MPTQSYSAPDFLGLTPGVDARRSDKLFVLAGENYVFDSIGPKSDFGNRMLTPYPLGFPNHTQGCRLKLQTGDRIFTFAGDSILEWDELAGNWRVIYVTPRSDLQPFRWTQGYLDGNQYFCHPAVGILCYDLTIGFCLPLSTPGVPNEAIAIVVNNGRLCAIDSKYFYFSATSDGKDWVPRLGGAGFYKIADRVSGSPLMVTGYAGGTFTWTTGGVMVSQFTGEVEVFRHRALNTDLRPINSFCTVRIDEETVVVLDERGLFQSKGQSPTPFSPLFNEYLSQFIQRYNIKVGQNARLEWDDLQRRLYVSLSLSFDSPAYEICFVLYPNVDKWGQFNEPHLGILPLRIATGSRADDYFGFVDSTGRVRYWNQLGSRETLPTSAFLNSVYPAVQKSTHYVEGDVGRVVSSTAQVNSVPTAAASGVAGYYDIDVGTNSPATLTGLSARIQLGLVSFELGQSEDQMTEVTQITIGNMIEGDPTELSQGFSLSPLLESESFGLAVPNFVNCQLRILSTTDGKSVFDSCLPELTVADRGARHYAASTIGVWHVVELQTQGIGEAFQLRSLSLTAAYAGKLL